MRHYQNHLEELVEQRTYELFKANDALKIEILERKINVKALEESEQWYRRLVETMNEGLIVMDDNNIITYTNPKFQQMLGYSENELLGNWALDIIYSQGNIDKLTDQLSKRKLGQEVSHEITLTHKNDSQLCAIIAPRGIYKKNGSFKGSFAVITDITHRKDAEYALRTSDEKLIKSKKELIRLTNKIHNSIKNKLDTVKGHLNIIMNQDNLKQFEALSLINNLVSHSANECKNILFVTTNQQCRLKTIICEFDFRADLSLHPANIHYTIQHNEIPDEVFIAPDLLQFILDVYTEAINNIMKHSYASQVKVDLNYNDNQIVLTVADNGIGFDYQNQKDKEGSYGLKLISQYSNDLAALFEIKSDPGNGTILKIISNNKFILKP